MPFTSRELSGQHNAQAMKTMISSVIQPPGFGAEDL
jgi:hypothetical protein